MKKQNNINEIEPVIISTTASILFLASKVYNEYLSKAAKSCKAHTGSARTICLLHYKQKAIKLMITKLNQGKSKCSKTKNPEKCIEKINEKIKKQLLKLKTYNSQLKILSRYKLKDGVDITNDVNELCQTLYEYADQLKKEVLKKDKK